MNDVLANNTILQDKNSLLLQETQELHRAIKILCRIIFKTKNIDKNDMVLVTQIAKMCGNIDKSRKGKVLL